jgi:hypothetical protein
MPRKGAIELSLGFIVAVVFAVVLLSLAIYWLNQVMGGIGGLTDDLTQQAQSKLQETFQSSQNNFAIWPDRYSLDKGRELKMSAGIKNDADDGEPHRFVINVIPAAASQGPCPGGDLASCPTVKSSMEDWVTGFTGPVLIQSNKLGYRTISVKIPNNAVSGTYIFNVVACGDIQPDPITSSLACTETTLNWGSSAQQLTITVK